MEIKTLQRLSNLLVTLIDAVEQRTIKSENLYSRFSEALNREGVGSLAAFVEAIARELKKPVTQLVLPLEYIKKFMLIFPNAIAPLKAPGVRQRFREIQTSTLARILGRKI